MSTAQLLVTFAGAVVILWVNYYFFLAGRGAVTAAPSKSGAQRIRIEVKGGYSPAVVRVQAGRPVQLDFYRAETSGCTEEVVLPDFGIRTFLPPFKTTTVAFTPTSTGSHQFSCGMGMVRGRIVVESGAEARGS